MKKTPSNLAASVRQRLLNAAKRRDEAFDYVLTRYARERFLVRLQASPHRRRLVLKGATVLAVWPHDLHRPTRDLDFLGTGEIDVETSRKIVSDICATEVEADGLTFDTGTIVTEVRRTSTEECVSTSRRDFRERAFQCGWTSVSAMSLPRRRSSTSYLACSKSRHRHA